MEKDTKITDNTEKKQGKHLFKKGESGNPNGRPKGSENFSTKWFRLIDKLAKQDNLTAEEIEQQLMAVGYKRAKEGDYSFYRDSMDRIYGKPVQINEIGGRDGKDLPTLLVKFIGDEETEHSGNTGRVQKVI